MPSSIMAREINQLKLGNLRVVVSLRLFNNLYENIYFYLDKITSRATPGTSASNDIVVLYQGLTHHQ